MTVPDLDLVVAIAVDLDDRRLQLADVVILQERPTVVAAGLAAAVALYRLPGCALVAVGAETAGCLLCGRDVRSVFVNTADMSLTSTIDLALGYYLSSLLPTAAVQPCAPVW